MNVNISDIAALAALDLSPAEGAAMERDLASILDYIAQLSRIVTEGVEAMAHLGARLQPAEAQNEELTLRRDEARAGFSPAEALGNTPAQAGGMFEVPKIVERG
ncbi:MAG: Asp-tRNA(Asn)/Glu-tRNA(Gln) amidotransferase subunit GatC [Terriglobales bacterium]